MFDSNRSTPSRKERLIADTVAFGAAIVLWGLIVLFVMGVVAVGRAVV